MTTDSKIKSQNAFSAKLLIIRFSSLGDITQCLEVVSAFKSHFRKLNPKGPPPQVHWVVRSDFGDFLRLEPEIDQIWPFKSGKKLSDLWALGRQLKKEDFTHIYDAHSSLRSHVLSFQLVPVWLSWKRAILLGAKKSFSKFISLFQTRNSGSTQDHPMRSQISSSPQFLRRSKGRWKRGLLFKFRINLFPKPFQGCWSFLNPLEKFGIQSKSIKLSDHHFCETRKSEWVYKHQDWIQKSIVLAPSAAWELKRWPMNHWKQLIQELKEFQFTLLGGPNDDFCKEIEEVAPERVLNASGQLSWVESSFVIQEGLSLVSGDTGAMHIGDYLNRPTIALIGPTAFGYPCRTRSHVLEIPLSCRPCTKDGRGRCVNSKYQFCLTEISPLVVAQKIRKWHPKLSHGVNLSGSES